MKKKLTNKHNGAVLIVDEKYLRHNKHYGNNYSALYETDKDCINTFPHELWELSDYEEKPPIYYIRGNEERGDEVIKMLKEKGGRDFCQEDGKMEDCYYYCVEGGKISIVCQDDEDIAIALTHFGTELHLPELPEKKEDIMQQALRTEYEKGRADVLGKLLSDEELAKIANEISTEIKTVIIPHFLKILAKEEQ